MTVSGSVYSHGSSVNVTSSSGGCDIGPGLFVISVSVSSLLGPMSDGDVKSVCVMLLLMSLCDIGPGLFVMSVSVSSLLGPMCDGDVILLLLSLCDECSVTVGCVCVVSVGSCSSTS